MATDREKAKAALEHAVENGARMTYSDSMDGRDYVLTNVTEAVAVALVLGGWKKNEHGFDCWHWPPRDEEPGCF